MRHLSVVKTAKRLTESTRSAENIKRALMDSRSRFRFSANECIYLQVKSQSAKTIRPDEIC